MNPQTVQKGCRQGRLLTTPPWRIKNSGLSPCDKRLNTIHSAQNADKRRPPPDRSGLYRPNHRLCAQASGLTCSQTTRSCLLCRTLARIAQTCGNSGNAHQQRLFQRALRRVCLLSGPREQLGLHQMQRVKVCITQTERLKRVRAMRQQL